MKNAAAGDRRGPAAADAGRGGGAGYRRAAEAAPNVRDDANQLVQT
ncbi:MAG: hypothetical protein ACLRZH_07800 [Ruthenibacterium lactatiformans]